MKTSKFIYALGASVILSMSSCSGFLDTPTDTRVELMTVNQLKMLMNSSYPETNYGWPCEIMTDNFVDNNSPDENGLRYNLTAYDRGDDEMFRFDQCFSSSSSDSPFGAWESLYKSIAAVNHMLEAAEKIEANPETTAADKETLNALRGEGLVLRSFCHFILAQMFCMPYSGPENPQGYMGLTYMTKPESTVKPDYKREPLQDTYANIVKDFEEGFPLLDNTIYDQPKYHFNTAAAAAYGARLFLFMRQYNKAFNYANMAFGAPKMEDPSVDAVTANAVDATPFMSDIWSKLDQFYYVHELGLVHNSTSQQSVFMVYPTYSILSRHARAGRYATNRSALNATIHSSSPVWGSFKWSSRKGNGGSFSMHPCFNGWALNAGGKSDYGSWWAMNAIEQFEVTNKIAQTGYAHITRREFFGEETLLVRAEARLFLGDIQGAVDDLIVWEKKRRECPSAAGSEDRFVDFTIANIQKFYVTNLENYDPESIEIESGHGIAKPIHIDEICPAYDAKVNYKDNNVYAVLQCIQHMRRIELLDMGNRWFDIKRLGLEYSHFVGKDNVEYRLTVHDNRKAIQIPSDVIAAGYQENPREEEPNRGQSDKLILLK